VNSSPLRYAFQLLAALAQFSNLSASASDDSTQGAPRDARMDVSVVGRPFPLSKSVSAWCPTFPDKCTVEYQLLQTFAEEPKDVAWATDIEAKLRKHIRMQGSAFSIRTLECRRTVCAGELTSAAGEHFNRTLPNDAPLEHLLQGQMGVNGYERNEQGERVTVWLILYKRR
jgi:hypothetical protein